MAVSVDGVYREGTRTAISNCKLLIVGAGGIGCELLKTLVLMGFENLHVIDLDTIELSNLNRQFLFHKQHIGRPKAVVAKENVQKFNPKAKIVAQHDSITNTKYNVEFYRQFTAVLNALDNIAARSHVNRMCIAANVPLLESGSAGYLGQTTVYKKGVTECFECLPRQQPKTYPGCTIRNTPSEPVHCIVWAKHLFNQLFGEADIDEEVSPDLADPELGKNESINNSGNVVRISTREWAKSTNYDPEKLFKKLFNDDIQYLHEMSHLWEGRTRPRRLSWNDLPDAVQSHSQAPDVLIKDKAQWSIKQCAEIFEKSLSVLRKRAEAAGPDNILTWDKDDEHSMNFVASCTNLRAYCFHISQLSRFEIKSIAGNIVPAIAATNANIAGLIVLQLLKVIKGDTSKCKTVWLNGSYATTRKLISSCELSKPNPQCLVCSSSVPEIIVRLNLKTFLIKTLKEKILKEKLHVVQPDVMINDLSAKILISSDPDDMQDEGIEEKSLAEFGIDSETRLLCEDFFQHYKIILITVHFDEITGQDFKMDSDFSLPFLQEREMLAQNPRAKTNSEVDGPESENEVLSNENMDICVENGAPSVSKNVISPFDVNSKHLPTEKKKVQEEENRLLPPAKKAKTN